MKNFAPLQITALAVLSVIVIALAIAAFATGNSLATETVEVAAAHTTPQIIEIRLADNTNMPTPVPIPAPTPTPEATEAPTSTPTRAPKTRAMGYSRSRLKTTLYPSPMAWRKRHWTKHRGGSPPRCCPVRTVCASCMVIAIETI